MSTRWDFHCSQVWHHRVYRACLISGLFLTTECLSCVGAQAQNPPAAPMPATPPAPQTPPPTTPSPLATTQEFRKGALYGHVLDTDGKPVPKAMVALQDKSGKVLAWTKTNDQGEYAIAIDPMTALQLRASRRRGLLEQCVRAVGDVVTAPVKIVGSAVTNPGKTAGSAVVSVASGTPAPLVAQTVVPVIGDKAIAGETSKSAGGAAASVVVGQSPTSPKPVVEKGEAILQVSAPNFKEARGNAGVYWLEGPCTDKDRPMGMQAWLETVKLAPATTDKASEIVQEALTLTEPMADPTLILPGGTVKLKVKLQSPPGPEHPVRVFAREARKNIVTELMAQPGADKNVFVGTLTLDPKTPVGETVLSIAALRAEPVEVQLDKKKADPLIEFVKRLPDMQANKPYEYDPRIMASENRVDIRLTVLDAKKQTPTTPPAPASNANKGKP